MNSSGQVYPHAPLPPPRLVVGDFFGYSCVPGVQDPQHDPRGSNPRNLCEACIGDDNDRHICANNPRERHFGEAGALR